MSAIDSLFSRPASAPAFDAGQLADIVAQHASLEAAIARYDDSAAYYRATSRGCDSRWQEQQYEDRAAWCDSVAAQLRAYAARV